MMIVKEVRICLDEYALRFSPARDADICGCRELTDLYCAQTAVAHTGISLEGESDVLDNS